MNSEVKDESRLAPGDQSSDAKNVPALTTLLAEHRFGFNLPTIMSRFLPTSNSSMFILISESNSGSLQCFAARPAAVGVHEANTEPLSCGYHTRICV